MSLYFHHGPSPTVPPYFCYSEYEYWIECVTDHFSSYIIIFLSPVLFASESSLLIMVSHFYDAAYLYIYTTWATSEFFIWFICITL